MGHVLAMLISNPDDPKVQSIQFAFNHENPFDEGFKTVYKTFQWNFPGQWNQFCLTSMAGGVFQQMKSISKALTLEKIHYNFIENLIKLRDKDKAYRHLLKRLVKSNIEGMEEDIKELRSYYWQCRDKGLFKKFLDLDQMKNATIDALFHCLKEPQIDSLCNNICDEILLKYSKKHSVFHKVHIETIMYYMSQES